MLSKLGPWIKELRAPFFVATVVPVVLGAVVAWSLLSLFNPVYFMLSLIGALCLNAGTNMANDYFDFKSRCDLMNVEFVTPFSGGSRLLPEGVLKPRDVHIVSLIFFGLGGLILGFLALQRGWIILFLGIFGILSGYFYTTQLATRGVGELFVGLSFGPFMVLGSYYVQAQNIILEPLVASIPVGLLIVNVLWINEIPDYIADKQVGKKTLVVRLGKKRASRGHALIMLATYVSILLGVILKLMPAASLITLVTLPMAIKAVKVSTKYYNTSSKLVAANIFTLMTHTFVGLLLILGYIIQQIAAFP